MISFIARRLAQSVLLALIMSLIVFFGMFVVGDPVEMGPIAVFLASGASDYMNGEMFIIDGGAIAGGYAPTGYAPDIPLEL